MRISGITVYQVDLPVRDGGFRQSGGRVWRTLDSTIVRVDTDEGVSGWGEACPFGPNYVPAFVGGVRASLGLLCPALIGVDPVGLLAVNRAMDEALYGHGYAKTALDIACWDIAARVAGRPLCDLLGGRLIESNNVGGFFSLHQIDDVPHLMPLLQEAGAEQFEFKASGDTATDLAMIQAIGAAMRPHDRLKVDVNEGWRVDQAILISKRAGDVACIFEQPCRTYEECRAVKHAIDHPVSLDECVHTVQDLLRAHADRAIDQLNLKIGRIGGLTRSRQMRDLCVTLGIPVYIQDTAGSEFNAASTMHLAHSTPPHLMIYAWDCTNMNTIETGRGLVREDRGVAGAVMRASGEPGLGVEPLMDILGAPVAEYR